LCIQARCTLKPVMGNGIVEFGEACDDGNLIDGDGCSSTGKLENGQACTGDRDCMSLLCRDGTCQPYTSNDQCGSNQCKDGNCVDICGNGVVDAAAGEECDEGPQNSNFEPNRCRTDCRNPACGDGIADRNEQCDDGNRVSGDGCDRQCRIEVQSPINPGNPNAASVISTSHPPAGKTGPAAIGVMAAGAAGGWSWMRRKRGLAKAASEAKQG
jgi:cysteine-rich repeat protein